MDHKNFAIVIFKDKKNKKIQYSVVPTKWLISNEEKCYWPDNKTKNVSKLFSDPKSIPGSSWKIYDVQVKKYYGRWIFINFVALSNNKNISTYVFIDSYEKALAKSSALSFKSDIESSETETCENSKSNQLSSNLFGLSDDFFSGTNLKLVFYIIHINFCRCVKDIYFHVYFINQNKKCK